MHLADLPDLTISQKVPGLDKIVGSRYCAEEHLGDYFALPLSNLWLYL